MMIGVSWGDVRGIGTTMSSAGSMMALMRVSPSLVIAMTDPPRALASWILPSIFSNTASSGATATIGMFSSTSAIGPCFISPAG